MKFIASYETKDICKLKYKKLLTIGVQWCIIQSQGKNRREIKMKYLGMEFKNKKDLLNWSKEGNVSEYKKLSAIFNNSPSMEISSKMSDVAETLVTRFGLTWDEIEELETV